MCNMKLAENETGTIFVAGFMFSSVSVAICRQVIETICCDPSSEPSG